MRPCAAPRNATTATATCRQHGPYFEITYKANGKTVNVKLSPEAAPCIEPPPPVSKAEGGDDSFVVTAKEGGGSREIAFSELKTVNYPKRGYKAESTPDPVAARRMVIQLGVGEHIMVQVSPTEKVRGHIAEIRDHDFAILPDGETSTRDVPYNGIWKVNKNLSFGATVAIVALIAATVVLVLVLTGEEDVDVLPN